MKLIRIIGLLIVVSILGPAISNAENKNGQKPEMTLSEAYELSLKQSESLQRKEQDILGAEARYREALAAIYPNLHFITSERIRNSESFGFNSNSNNSNTSSNGSVSNNGSRSNSKDQFETSFNLKQPIFNGFREFLISDAAKLEISAIRNDRERAKELLYLDVADVFHQIVLYSGDLKILNETTKVLNQRIDELGKFIELGKSKDSEILAARSDIADLEVTKSQVQGLMNASKELLAFLTGLPASELNLKETPDIVPVLPLDNYLEQVKQRNDVQAAAERRDSSEKQVTATERERWPGFNFEGNLYPYESPDSDREWDLLFKMDIPIFEGGAISARADQQRAILQSNNLALSELKRASERDVRVAFQNYESAKDVVKSSKSLVESSRKNYESQRKDYEVGVVTNLDVLQSIRQKQDAVRRLLQAETDLRVDLIRLQIAAGGVS